MSEKQPGPAAQAGKPGSAAKARPTKTLPTERIQFSKLLDILRGYAAASGPGGKPVIVKEVADIVKMVESTVSISNAFFTDTGLIIRTASGLLPSQDVLNYHLAYNWNPETAAHKLAPTLRATWFGQKLITRLGFKRLNESEAIQVLAEEANASKDYQKNVVLLIDFLEKSGIVLRENGVLGLGPMAGDGMADAPRTPAIVESDIAPPSIPQATQAGKGAVATAFSAPTIGAVQFHVSVKVDMSEFKGWEADRLTAFFNGIAQVLAAKGRIEEGAAS